MLGGFVEWANSNSGILNLLFAGTVPAATVITVLVRNIGRGSAYDLRFDIDRGWEGHEHTHSGDLAMFQNGIKYLAPDQQIRSFVGTYMELDHGPLAITVKYKGKSSRRSEFIESCSIDVRRFEGTLSLGDPPEREVVRALDRIANDISQLRRGWSPLKVRVDGVFARPKKRYPIGHRSRKEISIQRILQLLRTK